MILKITLLLIVSVLLSTPCLSAEPAMPSTAPGLVLKTLRRNHPRLMLTDPQLADLKATIARGDDALLTKCVRDVLHGADKCLRKEPLRHVLVGPRLLSVSRDCLQRVYALGLAYRLTGKEQYAARAVEDLLAVCAFEDWNPSHFLDTAEMSHAVGIGYDWLHSFMDAPTRVKIREGLVRLGLKPGLEAYEGARFGWWRKSSHNWNQVCNGGLICGALAIAEDEPELCGRIVSEALASLPKAMASYAPDGGWIEGPGYWAYATNYAAYGLSALNSALGTDFGISNTEGFDTTGRFPLHLTGPTSLYFNFADVHENARRGPLPVLFWLAKRFDDAALAVAGRAALEHHSADPRHLIWYVPAPDRQPAPLPRDAYFAGVQVACLRSDWSEDALFVAVKGGDNQANHGHLDLGSFEFDALGVRWARDLGSDDYNLRGYWEGNKPTGKRWNYYRLGSLSHNVPLLDNENQNCLAKAKIVRFVTDEDAALAVVDLTEAYAPKATRATRGVALRDGRTRLLVQDEFELAAPAEIAWGMTTDAAIEVSGNTAVLKLRDKTLQAKILSPDGAKFEVVSAERQPPEKPNTGVRRLVIRVRAEKGLTRLAALLSPVHADRPVPILPALKPLASW